MEVLEVFSKIPLRMDILLISDFSDIPGLGFVLRPQAYAIVICNKKIP